MIRILIGVVVVGLLFLKGFLYGWDIATETIKFSEAIMDVDLLAYIVIQHPTITHWMIGIMLGSLYSLPGYIIAYVVYIVGEIIESK